MHVLTLTPFYPAACDDAMGCFIAEPLRPLQDFGINSSVMAVQPIYRGRMHPSNVVPLATWVRYPALPSGLGLSSAGVFLFASLLSKTRKLHYSLPIDLIHAHAALPCGHAAALLSRELGIPFVVTVHGLDAFLTNQVRGYAGRWCERVSQMVYRSARRVICISAKVRDRVVEGARAPVQTTVIYNGVNSEAFSPGTVGAESASVLSVGSLIPVKGHELLLRSFAAIQHLYPGICCDIVGKGPERSRLSTLASSLGITDKIRFLGPQTRSQVADAMRRCALFALPSRYEGLGCVYLEAMATEKAVIACHGQGIEEVIRQGFNGWLVEPEDLPALTNALLMLLENSDLRRRIGMAARETILAGFTLSHQASRLAEVYKECIE